MKRFRGGLVFKAHRLLHHSTLGLRVIKKRRRRRYNPKRGLQEKEQDEEEAVDLSPEDVKLFAQQGEGFGAVIHSLRTSN